jgi:hypothetical protein
VAASVIDLAQQSPDVILYGADPGDALVVIAPTGIDADCDGSADLIAIAGGGDGPSNLRPNAGDNYVVRGPFSAGTIDLASNPTEVILTLYGRDAGDSARLRDMVDVNGDGAVDLLITAPRADSVGNTRIDAGEVYVVFGSPCALPCVPFPSVIDMGSPGFAPDITIYGATPTDFIGDTGFRAIDVNGDQHRDLVVLAPSADGPGDSRPVCGEIYVFFGPIANLPTVIDLATDTPDLHIIGAEADDSIRSTRFAMSDINGDGLADFLVTAIRADGPDSPTDNSRPDSGEIVVLSGVANLSGTIDLATWPVLMTVYAQEAGDVMALTDVQDFNNDGRPDLLFSANNADGLNNALPPRAGDVYLVRNHDPNNPGGSFPSVVDLATFPIAASFHGDDGNALYSGLELTDVSGDEVADLIAHSFFAGQGQFPQGRVFVRHGPFQAGANTSSADLTIIGRDSGDSLSSQPDLFRADLSGDGKLDMVVNAGGGDGPTVGGTLNTRVDSGEVYILFGATAEDVDGDGILLPVDGHLDGAVFVSDRTEPSTQFTDRPVGGRTSGAIEDAGGLTLTVRDARDPDGVMVRATGAGGPATVNVCGLATDVFSGTCVILTCGSLTAQVLSGMIQVHLGSDALLTATTGATVNVEEAAAGQFEVENKPGSIGTVEIVIAGQVIPVTIGMPIITPLPVAIDIKPGDFRNGINLGSGGSVPVAILSTASFDATGIDPTSVIFAGAPVKLKGQGTPSASPEDVNGDEYSDLVLHFSTRALQVSADATQAVLKGQTFGGTQVVGIDTVRVVP